MPGFNIENLIRAVVPLSIADDYSAARKEWKFHGYYVGRDECVCGHKWINDCYIIKNVVTGNELRPVGSTCIDVQFGHSDRLEIEKFVRKKDVVVDDLVGYYGERFNGWPLWRIFNDGRGRAYMRERHEAKLRFGVVVARSELRVAKFYGRYMDLRAKGLLTDGFMFLTQND